MTHLPRRDGRARQTLPGDPCVDLIALNAFGIRKVYAKVLAAVDRLEKIVGGDPYLKLIRATTLLEQGGEKNHEAAKLAQGEASTPSRPSATPIIPGCAIANGQKKYSDMAKFLGEYCEADVPRRSSKESMQPPSSPGLSRQPSTSSTSIRMARSDGVSTRTVESLSAPDCHYLSIPTLSIPFPRMDECHAFTFSAFPAGTRAC